MAKVTVNKKRFIIYLAVGIILAVILYLQSSLDKSAVLDVNCSINEENVTEVNNGLYLRSGVYQIVLGTYVEGTNDNAVIEFYTPDRGVLYSGTISNGISSNTYNLELKEKSNMVYIRIYGEAGKTVSIHSVSVFSDHLLYTDTVMWGFLLILLYVCGGICCFGRRKSDKNPVYGLILAGAVIWVSYPLMCDYLINGHDLNFQLYRIEGVKDALLCGQIPVRIHPTHNDGYGYATAVMYPELFLYLPALLRLAGVSMVGSWQAFMLILTALTAYIMYYSVKDMSKSDYAAVITSFIYVVASYRVLCVLERAAVGEVLTLCFLPLVIDGFYNVFIGDQKKWFQLVIGATGILQSHMIGTFLTLITVSVLGLIYIRRLCSEKRWLSLGKAVGMILLLNLWYIVPFLDFYRLDLVLHHTSEGLSIFYDNAVIPGQLFNLLADQFGFSNNLSGGMGGEMPMTLGIMVSLVFMGCLITFLIIKKKDNVFAQRLFLLGILFIICSTTIIPWKKLQGIAIVNKLTSLVQFPWRLLGFATVCILIAGGLLLAEYALKTSARIRAAVLAGVILAGAFSYLFFGETITKQAVYLRKPETIPLERLVETIGMNAEYLIDGTDTASLKAGECRTSGADVLVLQKNGTSVEAVYDSKEDDAYIEFPLLWYPGYSARTADGAALDVLRGDNNVVRVMLDGTGTGSVHLAFKGKILYHIAEAVSYVSLAAYIISKICIKRKRKFLQ